MDELRALPKQFAVVIFLKILLALVFIISVIILTVASVAVFLYVENYPAHTIIIFTLMTWIVFLLILLLILYFNTRSLNHTKDNVQVLLHKEALTFIALHAVNFALRKWHKSRKLQ